MALIAANLDYTDKDQKSILLRLQKLIQSVFPTWTDFNTATFGNILLESNAWVGDVLTFYQDNQAAEGFIDTATQRKSLLSLAKWHGYKPKTASAATATETFSIPAVRAFNVTIPAGTIVSTIDVTSPVSFQLLANVVITAGTTSATGTVENSQTFTDTFTSAGLANESYVLSRTPYIDSSTSVLATGSLVYTEQSNFLNSLSTDRHFVVTVDNNDQATITFGNGVNGATLPAGDFTVTYKVGGGAAGNVEAGAIKRISGSFADASAATVVVSVTNAAAASGGADRESIEDLRKNIPASLRTLTRAVAREDYEFAAKQVSGVARALMLTSEEETGIAENSGDLFIIPTGASGSLPTQTLKDNVLAQFQAVTGHPAPSYPKAVTFFVSVQDPVYLTVNISVLVYLKTGAVASTVKSAITTAVSNYFALNLSDGSPNTKVDFGFNYKDADGNPAGSIAWSDIFDLIRDVTGVSKVDAGPDGLLLNGVRSDLIIGNRQFPVLGTLTILNGATGLAL